MFNQMPAHPFQRCQRCARPHSASPTADLSIDLSKRKTDDCTPLRGRPLPVHSAPHRHQTCRAEEFIIAHITGKSVPSATENTQRYRSSRPLLQRGFRQRLHPRFRSSPSPPMSSYLGPGRLAALSAAAYSVPQPSLTSIPLRSIPFVPASLRSLRSDSHKTPGRSSDSSGVRSAQLSSRNLQDCPGIPVRRVSTMSISTAAKSGQPAIPCRHPILSAPLRSSRQTAGIYVT